MPFRFFRRVKIAPGFHLNISKSGLGFSQKIGPVTLGTKRTTLNLPGTGASIYVNNSNSKDNKDLADLFSLPEAAQTATPAEAKAPPSTNRKAINLIIAFIAVFCCVCIGIGFIANGMDTETTPTPVTKKQQLILPTETFTSVDSLFPSATAPKSFASRTPIPPPTRRPTWTPEPATNTPLPIKPIVPIIVPGSGNSGGVCSCSGDTMNCTNFGSQSSAQACYNYCVKQGKGDIHKLDQDNNGVACESN